MSRPKHTTVEYRNYLLPANFPIILLSGDMWRISDVPSNVLHFHNCLEIGICLSDSGTIEFSGQKIPFKKGDMTFIAKDVPHTTYSSPGTKSKWAYIFVNIQVLMSAYFPMDLVSGSEKLNKLLLECSTKLSREDHPDIYELLIMIINELEDKKENYQFTVRGLCLAVAMKLNNIYKLNISSEINEHSNSLVIAPAIDYIRSNYMDDFPMENLAGMCGMSPTHFRRVFHQIMGFGALEYTNRIRITRAQELLKTTEESILEISEEVGFQSISSFNRHFSEIVGMTPTAYRKKNTVNADQSITKCTGWMTPPED